MSKIVVLGAGACGLAAALMLARDGHDVTVLERDRDPVPGSFDEAWERWERAGVAQFRQAHFLQARGCRLLEAELPDVRDALVAAGAVRFDPLEWMPPAIADRDPRPGDDRFATRNARRPVLERAFAAAAEKQPGLEVRRGVPVSGVVTRTVDGTPHVAGVRIEGGQAVAADLVVDAMGRGSRLPRWLDAPIAEEAEPSGFLYYTRFFRSTDDSTPPLRSGLNTQLGSFAALTIPADDGTWGVVLCASAGDRALKRLRHESVWNAVLAACPRHAHWLDGTPITGVLPMGGIVDRRRRLMVDGRPAVTGLALLADAWACTNPSLGRGIALGLAHAALLRDVARAHLDDPRRFALEWDAATERELTPWYRATVAFDRGRLAQMEAERTGGPAPNGAGGAFARAIPRDPEVFRAALEISNCFTLPEQVLARPGFSERVREAGSPNGAGPKLAPTREELLRLLG